MKLAGSTEFMRHFVLKTPSGNYPPEVGVVLRVKESSHYVEDVVAPSGDGGSGD